MNNYKKNYLNKDDFKRYKLECSKISLINSDIKNKEKFINLIDNNKISYFFDFNHDDTSFRSNNLTNSKNIESGIEVGNLAKEYFKKIKDNNWKDFDNYNQSSGLIKTNRYLADKSYNILFEPIFVFKHYITKCDVLKRFLDGWEIIEVKAVSKFKKEHLYDLIFQYFVLKNIGLKIYNLKLMYLNNNYKLENKLNLNMLFLLDESFKINKEDKKIIQIADEYISNNIQKDLDNLSDIIFDEKINFEEYLLSKKCNNGNINYCHHVIKNIPKKDTIFNLHNLRYVKKIKFMYDEDIIFLKDIDLNQNYFHKFNDNQKIQIQSVKKQKDIIKLENLKYIKEILKNYKYPIYMYDFETVSNAIPKFEFTSSYQQIPFQYSVHILKNSKFNYENNKNIDHFYYLSDGDIDPRSELIKKLVIDCFYNGKGVYVAYNKHFEIMVLKELINFIEYDLLNKINIFQNHEYLIEKILYIKNNTIDLMDFFNNFLIYKKEFNGSLSIKSTLPAFDNNFSYKNLNIQKGDVASELFRRRIQNKIKTKKWISDYRNDMIKYCNQDTLGMVVLFKKLLDLLNKSYDLDF